MKIFQFMPNSLNKAPDKTNTEKLRNGPKTGKTAGGDFASVLKAASGRAGPAGAGGAVSQENLRASRLPSSTDLGQAGLLLSCLDSDIRAATPEMLRNVHNLEGLVYVYSKNNA